MSTARDTVLQRIRDALRGPAPETTVSEARRSYRFADDAPLDARIALFRDRVQDYRARAFLVTEAGLPAAIAQACQDRGAKRLVVPVDLPGAWLPPEPQAVRDHGLSYQEIESADGVVTGCALAIAQTGTIVLNAGEHQGRRVLTLLPDHHLCVVRADQIVGLVPEAVRGLAGTATAPQTWISGPSATSDIELSRVEGVHGPRRLDVFILQRP